MAGRRDDPDRLRSHHSVLRTAGISPPKVKAYGTVDLQGVINPTKAMSATVGLKNAFNTKPPYVNGAGGAFQSGYDPTYVDPHGRFWYVSATLRFQ